MHILPQVNPLYEKISSSHINIPDMLEKLGNSSFSGYLHHTAADFDCYAIFAGGKLLSVLSETARGEKTGLEALTLLFATVLSVDGEINVYRLTPELALCAHAVTHGSHLFKGEEVRLVDVKGILARLKVIGANGIVRFYTSDRSALMFYKDGLPIGFYHDGSLTIDATPDETRKIAALPGARVEVRTTRPLEELMQFDLLQMLNMRKLWESACSKNAAARQTEAETASTRAALASEKQLAELVDDLSELAVAYLTKAGRTIVEQRIAEQGGSACLLDDTKRKIFLAMVEFDALASDADARIDEMIELMKAEIAGRLAA